MPPTSRFLYGRSITDDFAACLADVRARTWCEPQRLILDDLIRAFIDQAIDHDSAFDIERFTHRSQYWHGRTPPDLA